MKFQQLSARAALEKFMLQLVSDSPDSRTDIHNDALLAPKGREAMVRSVLDDGLSKAEAARQFRTTTTTVAK